MKIMVTGWDGYCGFPVVLKLLKEIPDCTVFGIDNQGRRSWVKEVGSRSLIPIELEMNRAKAVINEFGPDRFKNRYCDVSIYNDIAEAISSFKPNVILHLASQPSAPYGSIDIDHCNFTQNNNMQMLRNICWALNTLKFDTHLVVTTTTGVYGAPDFNIPEGGLVINEEEIPYPAMGGSWYHQSRAFDSGNLFLAARQFNFPITEMRTSIVCGTSTKETRLRKEFNNRFDVDFYFGVVLNRFVAQAIHGQPITIYGKGLQKKPLISLEDMVSSMVSITQTIPDKKYEIYNQMEKEVSIIDLATSVKNTFTDFNVEVKHTPNPRIENEEHQMIMKNDKFKKLIKKFECPIEQSIIQMYDDLKNLTGEYVS